MKASRHASTPVLLIAVFLTLQSCGKKKVAAAPPPANPRPAAKSPPPKIGDTETGTASWYGHPYHGRQAADGEIYDMEKLTAAHRTLPFNTWVRVENLGNGKTVEVRIIDRGPFVGNRIVDLSHAAAQQIEMIGPGTAQVKLVVIKPPPTSVDEGALFAVQVGIFRNKENAGKLQAELKARYGVARVIERQGNPPVWRVLVGEESTPEKAEALAVRVRGDISVPEAYVVRLDPQ
jgi:rare lipoprotein A